MYAYMWIHVNIHTNTVNTYTNKLPSLEDVDQIASGVDLGTMKQPNIVVATVRAIRTISVTGMNQVSSKYHRILSSLQHITHSDFLNVKTLVLSGISGSGKTFAARQILAATLRYTTKHSAKARPAVEKLIPSAYDVLDSLGNCKTSFNFDSSRHGSSFEVY